MSWYDALGKRVGMQGIRIVLLVALIAGSGVAIGLAAAYPLQYVEFDNSNAIRLDRSLAGTIDPKAGLVTAEDLPTGWTPGDPAAGAFGVLGQSFCGDAVKVPTPLSGVETAVFTNPTDKATVVSQAQRVKSYQDAAGYLDDVSSALDKCIEFYQGDPPVKVRVRDGGTDAPITDYVSRRYVSEGSQQQWSMMVVGDVIVMTMYAAPGPPAGNFLNDVESSVLRRIAPSAFAVGGITTETTAGDSTSSVPGTSVVDDGEPDAATSTTAPG